MKVTKHPKLDANLQTFLQLCQDRVNRHYAARLTNLKPDRLETDEGLRYVKVVLRRITPEGTPTDSISVHCFIDKATGDVYKAADWRKPAKHVRGNIFSQHGGLEAVSADGLSIYYLN